MTASREDLDQALPHILAAPKDRAGIALLCLRPVRNGRTFPDRLILSRRHGIAGDPSMSAPWLRLEDGSPDPRIQVSLLPLRVLDAVWRARGSVPHPGDPIVADLDVSVRNLPPGSLLRLGTATVRVSDLWNDGCVKWKVRYGATSLDWVRAHPDLRLRGILCSIEEDGEVSLRDSVEVIARADGW